MDFKTEIGYYKRIVKTNFIIKGLIPNKNNLR